MNLILSSKKDNSEQFKILIDAIKGSYGGKKIGTFPKEEKFFSGTSKKHYSPNKKIYLNIKKPANNSAYLNFGKKHKKEFKNLSKKGSLNEAATNLYHFIFLADQNKDFKTISIAPIPNRDIGEVINDRLKRAAR